MLCVYDVCLQDYEYVCVCMHTHVCVCTQMYVENRSQTQVLFLKHYPLCFWRKSLSLVGRLRIRIDWLASEPQVSAYPHLPSLGIISLYHHAWLYSVPGIELMS